jgi:AraC-like DNA-binding protein
VGIPIPTLYSWRTNKALPKLTVLLRICYRLEISLFHFLTGQIPNHGSNSSPSKYSHGSALSRSGRRVRLRGLLEAELKKDVPQPISVIASRAGIHRAYVSRTYPDLATAIKGKRKILAQAGIKIVPQGKRINKTTLRRLLELALELPGRTTVTDLAISLGYRSSDTLHRRFPEICAEFSRTKKDRIRAALELALESKSAPTMEEVAQRLGYTSAQTLRLLFPDLCRRITARHKALKPCRKDQMRVLVEAALSEDPPPSARQVCRRLELSTSYVSLNFPTLQKKISDRYREYKTHPKER